MSTWISEFDFNRTIREYDYTIRAEYEMRKIYDSDDFIMDDAESIFRYLRDQMELLSFGDYLKRYLYEKAELEQPFNRITDKEYYEMIITSFEETFTPFSLYPTTRSRGTIVGNWLSCDSIKRKYVFQLGFGLRMTEKEVSEFLMKVLKEHDFDVMNPEEAIYLYCFKNQLSYTKAQQLKERYHSLTYMESIKNSVLSFEFDHIKNEDDLWQYLMMLKKEDRCGKSQRIAYEHFLRLLEESKKIIVDIKNDVAAAEKNRKIYSIQNITYGDVESILCCGIPKGSSGNLQKASASLLGRHFDKKRMSRQRIKQLLSKECPVERFDLITLLFFLISQDETIEDPIIRYELFVEKINSILMECGMMKLYSANPYEAFIQMCLISDCPLAVYSDIWEMSYAEQS